MVLATVVAYNCFGMGTPSEQDVPSSIACRCDSPLATLCSGSIFRRFVVVRPKSPQPERASEKLSACQLYVASRNPVNFSAGDGW